ncbi:MAG: hypothetical protein J0L78_08835 [Planctomycetes bacterium]|nr:hypothetical protein [Planctomycetota bacterium]
MVRTHNLVRSFALASFSTGLVSIATLASGADCTPQWLPGMGVPGIDGEVRAVTMWDPDGPGPLEGRIAVGGKLGFPDGTFSGVAYWNGTEWVRIPGVFGGDVDSLYAMPDGRLLAGGSFSVVSGQSNLPPVVSWDGTSWSAVGTRDELHIGRVRVINRFPNGDVVAGGDSTPNVTHTGRGLARWNGSAWVPIGGAGISFFDYVNLLTFLPNGDLVIGGTFESIDGLAARGIARWNGSAWSSMGGGFTNNGGATGFVFASNGDLLVGGNFSSISGISISNLARWNGAAWSQFSPAPPTGISAMAGLPGGQFVMRGGFNQRIASKWDGTAYSPIATKFAGSAVTVRTMVALPDGRVVMGGAFEGFDGLGAVNVAAFEAGSWSAFGSGTDSAPLVFHKLSDGRLVAAGTFRTIAGVSASGIAIFNGATWSPLGTGIQGGAVKALAALPDGRLVVGGNFTSAGGVAVGGLATWNGSTWAALGTGIAVTPFTAVETLLYAPNNKLYIGGGFTAIGGVTASRIASWDGTNFAPLGAGCSSIVLALAWHSDKLIVGGEFDTAGGLSSARRIAAWNGASWSGLGGGITGVQFGPQIVYSLLSASDGILYVGGSFDQTNISYGLGRWDGTSWSSEWSSSLVATVPSVAALIELPNGDIVAGGYLTSAGTVPVKGIARRDHSTGTWSALAGGVTGTTTTTGVVGALGHFGNSFVAGGAFVRAGAVSSARVAFFTDDAAPQIAFPPEDVNADKGDTVVLSAVAAPGYSASAFQWERETAPLSGVYAPIANGPGGSSPSGGEVFGASGSLASPTTNAPIVLTIADAQPADSARYRLVVTGDCGSGASAPALVTVTDSCPGDINNDGQVDDADFTIFAMAYDVLDCSDPNMPSGCPADLNADTFVDDADFTIFASAYDQLLCP